MLQRMITGLRIIGAATLLSLNTLVHVGPLMVVALVKAVLRMKPVRQRCDRALMAIAASWIDCNSWMLENLTDTRLQVTGLPEPMTQGHFLLIANHQSWVDIPVLQRLFNRRLPLLRFFLKSQLIWVPVLGLAWWALDFPFMKRYSREQLARRPYLAGRDIAATRRACEKFRDIPVAIVNFVEGTRFSPAKHQAQQSDHDHLLKPRAGGTAFVLDAMGEQIDTLVDVTLLYPHGPGELVDLFANRIPEVRIHIRCLPIPEDLRSGDYREDEDYRRRFQDWINSLWEEKDRIMQALIEHRPP